MPIYSWSPSNNHLRAREKQESKYIKEYGAGSACVLHLYASSGI